MLPWHNHDPEFASLDRLPDGVERRQVGVHGADVPQEGRHRRVVVVLERKPRKDWTLLAVSTLPLLDALRYVVPQVARGPDAERWRFDAGFEPWPYGVGPHASHVVDGVNVEVDEDDDKSGDVPRSGLHFRYFLFLNFTA